VARLREAQLAAEAKAILDAANKQAEAERGAAKEALRKAAERWEKGPGKRP
jgi:hypothetical protein